MKNFCLFGLIMSLPVGVCAMENMVCETIAPKNNYQVIFQDQYASALVKKDNSPLEFGELKCIEWRQEFDIIVTCMSKGVVDAGYRATLHYSLDTAFIVELYEISFAGAKFLATLPCVSASH